jgi:hypothetical protein
VLGGGAAGASVGAGSGGGSAGAAAGSGGASAIGILSSTLLAVVTLAAIQPNPSGVDTCHHDESALRPMISRLWLASKLPTIS